MDTRYAATRLIWVATAVMLTALFASTFAPGNTLGFVHVIITSVLAALAYNSTDVIWRSSGTGKREQPGKSKREALDRLADDLHNLSPDDLHHLRARLSESHADLLHHDYDITDEGELQHPRKR